MSDLLSIGDLARAGGLPVSALRYYDTHGVLVPAVVDSRTGYRRYAPEQVLAAQVVAGLRRIGLPVAEMPAVLERLDDVEQVEGILRAHVAHLEAGVESARAEADRIVGLLGPQPVGTVDELLFPAAGFAAALEAVAYAAAGPDEAGVLRGIRLEASRGVCTWTATDRYRLATTTSPVGQAEWNGTVPVARLRACLAAEADGLVRVPGDVETVEGDYPDVSALRPYLGQGRVRATTAAEVRARLMAEGEDRVRLDGVLLDRRYLLEALDALPGDDLLLELEGSVAPLALRHPTDGTTWSLLMPIRDEARQADA